MKVLIVGSIISAGIQLIENLLMSGCFVVVAGETEHIAELEHNNLLCYEGDISNHDFFNQLFALHKFDSVIFILDKEKPFYQQETLNYFKESVSSVTYIMEQMVLYKIPSFILLSSNENKSSGYEKTVSAVSTLLNWTEERYGVHSIVLREENLNVDKIILQYMLSTPA